MWPYCWGSSPGGLARPAVGAGADQDGGVRRTAGKGVQGLRVGMVEEACGEAECEPAVLGGIRRTIAALERAGARVERISIPIWRHALAIFQPYIAHLIANMIRSEGEGYGHLGYIDVDRMHAFAVARRAESRELAPQLKCWMLADRLSA